MKIKVRIQQHLAVAWKAEDPGDWIFTLCRAGVEEILGQKLKTGDEVLLELDATLLEKE